MNRLKISKGLFAFLLTLIFSACGGEETSPTQAVPASVPNANPTVQLPATNTIATPMPESAFGLETPALDAGSVISDDDFLPIDEILDEIDSETCQNAYQTKAEIEAMMADGADLAELEAAVEELIEELENCPTPTPS